MKKKNIGICTLYHSYNFGAFLQAFALQEFLKKKGYNVEFIKLGGKNYEKFIYLKNKNLKKMLYNFGQSKKFEKNFKLLNISKKHNVNYDVAIVGSDEIWNISNPSFIHHDSFFGEKLNCTKVISYAPSCNNVTNDMLHNYKKNYDFKKIDHVSVRDINTYNLVKEVANTQAEIVLDPTFLYGDYDSLIKKIDLANYIAVYGYEFSEKQVLNAKRFAKSHNLKLVSLGLFNEWCDLNIKMDAFEFLSYIKYSKYVITSTFHGTIFSILLKKDFVVFSNKKSKIIYLLKEFELDDRDYTEKSFMEILEIDYKKVDKVKVVLKDKSENWLLNAIEK